MNADGEDETALTLTSGRDDAGEFLVTIFSSWQIPSPAYLKVRSTVSDARTARLQRDNARQKAAEGRDMETLRERIAKSSLPASKPGEKSEPTMHHPTSEMAEMSPCRPAENICEQEIRFELLHLGDAVHKCSI